MQSLAPLLCMSRCRRPVARRGSCDGVRVAAELRAVLVTASCPQVASCVCLEVTLTVTISGGPGPAGPRRPSASRLASHRRRQPEVCLSTPAASYSESESVQVQPCSRFDKSSGSSLAGKRERLVYHDYKCSKELTNGDQFQLSQALLSCDAPLFSSARRRGPTAAVTGCLSVAAGGPRCGG